MDKEKAFEALFRQSYHPLYYFAIGLVKDGEVARDAVSRAYEQLWSHIADVSQDKWDSYVHRVVHHLCVDYVRSQMSKQRYEVFYKSLYGDNMADDDERLRENEALIARIETLIDDLTPQTRRILEACYFQHKKYAEVAAELGISASAVRKHIVKALKYFRDNIQKKGKSVKTR